MAGRHAFTPEVAKGAIQSPVGRSAIIAAAVGTVFGAAIPVAHADTIEEVAPVATEEALATEAVTAPADAKWEVTQVTIDTQVEKASAVAIDASVTLPAPDAPVVTPAAAQGTAANATAVAQTSAPTSVNVADLPPSNSAVVDIARQYAGLPYVSGAAGPNAFDCSGFTQYVYAQVGIYLAHSDSSQRYAGTVIPASEAQPGDLMWWPGHVGIYTGNGQHIAARNPSVGVQEGATYGNPIYIRL